MLQWCRQGGGGLGGASAPYPPLQYLRFILSNIAVHCILRENICIYALNNIPVPPNSYKLVYARHEPQPSHLDKYLLPLLVFGN